MLKEEEIAGTTLLDFPNRKMLKLPIGPATALWSAIQKLKGQIIFVCYIVNTYNYRHLSY
jgi:hypothetical protein